MVVQRQIADGLTPRKEQAIVALLSEHNIHKAAAAQLRAEQVDIGIISKQLGHRSIATTAHYLDHIAPWDVVRVLQERQW